MDNEIFALQVRDNYPDSFHPSSSIFVHNQIKALDLLGVKNLVISPQPYIPNKIIEILKNISFTNKYITSGMKKYHSSPKIDVEYYEKIPILRPLFIKFPSQYLFNFTFDSLSHSISEASFPDTADVIHAHFGQNGAASLELKKKYHIPLVTSFYGYDSGRLSKKFGRIYERLEKEGDIFLALSQDMKNDLVNLGFSKHKILVHHLGVDIDKYKSSRINNNKFIFLSLARLQKGKGIQFAIMAMKNIVSDFSNVELRIVGSGPYESNLRNLVRKLELDKFVKFIDNMSSPNSRAIVRSEMSQCDVFLLPTYTTKIPGGFRKEGTPVVLMEAQSCSKPCISTNHAGIPEVIIDSETGFITKEKDIVELETKMRLLLENKPLLKEMGLKARKHIKKNFNHKIQIERLIKIYKKLT